MPKAKKMTALSMFCGCGGMDLGFHDAGFEVVWANDFNKDCCTTYRDNFTERTGGDVLHEGDISSISVPEGIGELTVLLGGFPCQAYSNAGSRNGVNDQRGRLYEYCMEFVRKLKPQFIVFENVRGFLSIEGRKGRLIEEIASALDENYEVHVKLLKASKYSVPQNRLRVFMVGVRRSRKKADVRTPLVEYRFPRQQESEDLTLGSILTVPKGTPNQEDVIRLNPQAYYIGKMVPPGGSWKDIEYDKLPPRLKHIRDNIRRYRWPNFYRKFDFHEIAGTVTAAFKPENAGVWHPSEDRTFSAREIARIQSFPDDFVFHGSNVKSIYQMIGNAVPPRLARAVAQSIIDAIDGKPHSNDTRDYVTARGAGPIRPEDPEMIFDPNGLVDLTIG